MNKFLKSFIIVAIIMLILDFTWIYAVMSKLYKKMIRIIQGSQLNVKVIPSIIAYFIMVLSILMFSLPNIRSTNRFTDSLYYGGMLGLFSYGLFSFTNLAIIEQWTISVALLDTLWGFLLFTFVSYLSSFLL